MKPMIKFFILIIILLFQQAVCIAQTDSTQIWTKALKNCKSQAEGQAIDYRINKYLQTCSDEFLITGTAYFLRVAAKSNSAKYIFYDLFYIFEYESQKRKLDKEFNMTVLKMEADPDFSNHDVKYQLYYFYTQFYYHLKEYYHTIKYLNLFLGGGKTAFPENMQTGIELNSLTTMALISRNKNDIDTAIQQFKAILELSRVKKNSAWEGITSGNLARSLFLANRYQEAISYYKTDAQLSIKNAENGSALKAIIALGKIYLKLKKLDTAYVYMDSANRLLTSILNSHLAENNHYLDDQHEILSFYGNYYNQTGDFKKSSDYFTKAFVLNDSIQQVEKSDHLKQIVQSIEVDRNINEINELHSELQDKRQYLTMVVTVVIAASCILILLSFFVLRLLSKNKQLKEQNEIINRQSATLEKINADNYKLFSIISHDVRGPAASVHRLLQLAGRKKLSHEDFEKLLPGLLSNSSNLNATIESLLTWSTAQFNGIETKPENIEVKSFIDQVFDLFQGQAREKSISLLNNCTPQNILIDKNQFEIIIRNTISNAIKFSHPNSVIQFNLKDQGTQIELSLSDNGIGMTEEQIGNIMEKGTLKTTSGTSGEKGIGLGLKLVKEFTEKNSGTFKIESRIDHGTNLFFSFPKAG